MQPPNNPGQKTNNPVAWPYYSETTLSSVDNSKTRNLNQNIAYQYASVTEEMKARISEARTYAQQPYRPTSLIEENMYQNCANQRCIRDNTYRPNTNHYAPVVRIGGNCSEYYQSLPRQSRNGRPLSPPPLEVSKTYHQTMVYIPYNHIEGYQSPSLYYSTDPGYGRVTNQNQINKRYLEPIYHSQTKVSQGQEEHIYQTIQKHRVPYPTPPTHLITSRSESPLPGQFATARSTQTPAAIMSTCSYYPNPVRYRPVVGPVTSSHNGMIWGGDYVTKINRHSFPAACPRYPPPDTISLTDSESQHSTQLSNGYRPDINYPLIKDSVQNSPTKPRFIERGVPEGAASVSPQDSSASAQSTSTMTSPTSPQNPPTANSKPLFYAMNV